jgi:predicted GNAT family N-acyltransferase
MPMTQPLRLDVKPVTSLTGDERAALAALTAAVYPPEARAASPGRHVRWASPEYSVLVWSPTGELVSHVGIVVRVATLDDAVVTVGGIGSVKTHPAAEGRGYASAGLRRAATVLHDDHHAAFSLLVCQDHLVAFYHRLGWRLFAGEMVVEQPGGRTRFTINRVMVQSAHRPAPQAGVIDLAGLPW